MHENTKTTWAGLLIIALTAAFHAVVPYLPGILGQMGNSLAGTRWSWIPAVVGALLAAQGPSAQFQRIRKNPRARAAQRRGPGSLLSLIGALSLIWTLTIINVGCGDTVSRKTLENLAGAGNAAMTVIEQNQFIPDNLFAAKLITAEMRDRANQYIREFKEALVPFNEGMTQLLAAGKPSLREMVPIVARIIQREAALRGLNLPWLTPLLTGVDISLAVISVYFATRIAQARAVIRRLGFKDERAVARRFGYNYDDLQTIETYAARQAA
jgi:hypothetical protein